MKPYITIITLGVNNLQRSFDFYSSLGFPSKGIEGDIAFFQFKGLTLALFPKEKLAEDAKVKNNTGSFAGITLAHNVNSIKEVDDIFQTIKKLGIIITDEPHKREWGGYSGYFQDPDGYLWEMAYNPYLVV